MKSTRQKIIDTTIKWVDLYGYETFSLRKLAKELNLSAAAIYKHFKNKEDLFETVTEQLSLKFMSNIQLLPAQSAEEKLLSLAQQLCQQFESHPNLMEFLFFNSQAVVALNHKNDDKYPFLKEARSLIHQINQTKDDDTLFIKLWSFIQGYALLIQKGVTKYDPEIVSSSLKQLLGGLS